MKTKTIVILAVIFIGLVLAYFIAERPGSDIYRESAKNAGPVFKNFMTDEVMVIEIIGKTNSVTLKKTDAGWIVDDGEKFPANESEIDTILQNVVAMDYSEIASENKENHAVFEVDEELGVKVRLLDDKSQPLAAFFSGKNGPGPEMNYIREDGSNTVTLQKGLHRYRFDKAVASWKDRSILKFDSSKVVSLEIDMVVMSEVEEGEIAEVVGKERIVFKKAEDTWNMLEPESRPGKKTALDNIVTILSNQNAASIPDQILENTGLDDPDIIVAVAMEDGTVNMLKIGNENPNRPNEFLAENVDKPFLYSISSFQVSRLMESVEDLTMEPEPEPAAETEDETGQIPPPPPDIQ